MQTNTMRFKTLYKASFCCQKIDILWSTQATHVLVQRITNILFKPFRMCHPKRLMPVQKERPGLMSGA